METPGSRLLAQLASWRWSSEGDMIQLQRAARQPLTTGLWTAVPRNPPRCCAARRRCAGYLNGVDHVEIGNLSYELDVRDLYLITLCFVFHWKCHILKHEKRGCSGRVALEPRARLEASRQRISHSTFGGWTLWHGTAVPLLVTIQIDKNNIEGK